MKAGILNTTLAAAATIVLGAGIEAQKLSPADAAARLSGTWTINRELTPGFRPAGGRRGGRGGGGDARFAAAPANALQRKLGGGDSPTTNADRTPEEMAAMAAMRELQQLAEEITINATADRVTFVDARGERSYGIDGKNEKMTVAGAEVSAKSRWDKTALKQEFSTASTKLIQTWEVDSDGRLVLIAKVESLRLRTPDQKAVFDKK